jgi:hypothetical protein
VELKFHLFTAESQRTQRSYRERAAESGVVKPPQSFEEWRRDVDRAEAILIHHTLAEGTEKLLSVTAS